MDLYKKLEKEKQLFLCREILRRYTRDFVTVPSLIGIRIFPDEDGNFNVVILHDPSGKPELNMVNYTIYDEGRLITIPVICQKETLIPF